jgi:hypothetical protein
VPDTFQALAVLVLALLPGALYVWSFERIVGPWGIGLSDRVLRFVGVSAMLHALIAPATLWLYVTYVRTGRLLDGHPPLPLWLVPLCYVGVPAALGSMVGFGVARQWRWALIVTGQSAAPRAWDYFFGMRPDGWVLLRLKTGTWLGGAYGVLDEGWRSYASGYPEAQDLFLVEAVEVDPDSGEILFDDEGEPVLRGSSLLIRWEEVEYLEYLDA